MKVKATPSDFIVREESSLTLGRQPSEFAVFKLSKTSWDTFDLVDLLSRRLEVKREDVSVGGMKDRHGSTEQMVSVRGLETARAGTTPRGLREANFSLEFQGWSDHPITARDIRGNRFEITLRDLTPDEARRVEANLPDAARDGIPNYYDEQRFGSARHGAGFMGKEIFLGHRERALRLWFTPSKHDDQKTRKMKRCVLENWARWEKCAGIGFGEYGRVLAYLAQHRQAYHQALAMLDRKFIVFVLNAYQSFLFNEVLSGWLSVTSAARGFSVQPLRYSYGTWQFYGPLSATDGAFLRAVLLPVPGHDTVVHDPAAAEILAGVLAAEEISLSDLRVRQMSRIGVGGVERAAVAVPEDLQAAGPDEDDLYPGRRKITLKFFLPRGSYATVLIKRLMLVR
jgi:tRNA pseudouridine13 synthase